MPNSGKLSTIGIKKEGSFGVAESTITTGICVNSFSVNPAITAEKVPETNGILMAKRSSAGNIGYEISFSFFLDEGDPTAIGQMLAGVFGKDTITGAGPYVHTFAQVNTATPISWTIHRNTGTLLKSYAGFRVGSVKFAITAGDPRIMVEVAGIAKVEATQGSQSLVFPTTALFLPSEVDFKIDTVSNTDFESIELTITREQEGVNTLNNSRNVDNIYSTDIVISGSISGIEPSTTTLRDKFVAQHDNTAERFDIDLNITKGAKILEIDLPKCFFETFEGSDIDLGAVNRVSGSFQALQDSGNQLVLTNDVATAYDA